MATAILSVSLNVARDKRHAKVVTERIRLCNVANRRTDRLGGYNGAV